MAKFDESYFLKIWKIDWIKPLDKTLSFDFLKNWNLDGLNQALGQNFDQIRIFLKFGFLMDWIKDKTNLIKSFLFFLFSFLKKWHFDGLDQALGQVQFFENLEFRWIGSNLMLTFETF